jgi:type IV pilus assembly protein PilN
MIRINLLPTKKRKAKRIAIPPVFTLAVPGAAILVALGAVFYWYLLDREVTDLKEETGRLQVRLAELKEKIKEVDRYEKDKKDLEEKVNLIRRLEKHQTIPVHVLDEVSRRVPDRVWLHLFTEAKGAVSIEGYAFSNSDIVTFVNNLKGAKYLKDVVLVESKETLVEKEPVYKFLIQGRVHA